jgi:hypothetical protein
MPLKRSRRHQERISPRIRKCREGAPEIVPDTAYKRGIQLHQRPHRSVANWLRSMYVVMVAPVMMVMVYMAVLISAIRCLDRYLEVKVELSWSTHQSSRDGDDASWLNACLGDGTIVVPCGQNDGRVPGNRVEPHPWVRFTPLRRKWGSPMGGGGTYLRLDPEGGGGFPRPRFTLAAQDT